MTLESVVNVFIGFSSKHYLNEMPELGAWPSKKWPNSRHPLRECDFITIRYPDLRVSVASSLALGQGYYPKPTSWVEKQVAISD